MKASQVGAAVKREFIALYLYLAITLAYGVYCWYNPGWVNIILLLSWDTIVIWTLYRYLKLRSIYKHPLFYMVLCQEAFALDDQLRERVESIKKDAHDRSCKEEASCQS